MQERNSKIQTHMYTCIVCARRGMRGMTIKTKAKVKERVEWRGKKLI